MSSVIDDIARIITEEPSTFTDRLIIEEAIDKADLYQLYLDYKMLAGSKIQGIRPYLAIPDQYDARQLEAEGYAKIIPTESFMISDASRLGLTLPENEYVKKFHELLEDLAGLQDNARWGHVVIPIPKNVPELFGKIARWFEANRVISIGRFDIIRPSRKLAAEATRAQRQKEYQKQEIEPQTTEPEEEYDPFDIEKLEGIASQVFGEMRNPQQFYRARLQKINKVLPNLAKLVTGYKVDLDEFRRILDEAIENATEIQKAAFYIVGGGTKLTEQKEVRKKLLDIFNEMSTGKKHGRYNNLILRIYYTVNKYKEGEVTINQAAQRIQKFIISILTHLNELSYVIREMERKGINQFKTGYSKIKDLSSRLTKLARRLLDGDIDVWDLSERDQQKFEEIEDRINRAKRRVPYKRFLKFIKAGLGPKETWEIFNVGTNIGVLVSEEYLDKAGLDRKLSSNLLARIKQYRR